jgi:hypothetical protein
LQGDPNIKKTRFFAVFKRRPKERPEMKRTETPQEDQEIKSTERPQEHQEIKMRKREVTTNNVIIDDFVTLKVYYSLS